jgi:beta-glucosidase
MCAYNLLNGIPACENPDLLQRVLRREWGFRGFVLSDYIAAVKSTVQSANAGLSVEFPVPLFYSPLLLSAAVAGGPISAATIDARVGEILRTMFAYGLFDRDGYPIDDAAIDAGAHAAVAQRAAEQGTVLLRNQGATLPLDAAKLKSIAVIGGPGDRYQNGGGSSAVKPLRLTTPLDGIMQRAGRGVDVRYDPADDIPGAAAAAHSADVAIVFAADSATEGIDRSCLSLSCPNDGGPNQDALIDAVLAANPRTIVVLEDSGPTLAPWADRVPAILQAWYPGEAGGKAIARILFGDVDPGGRLPATFPAKDGDWPTAGNRDQYPGNNLKATYSEKLLVGYRHYDAKRIMPRWPFGFGLSYTTFSMTRMALKRGGIARAAATVDVDVRNTGARAGEEVVQLYLGVPSTSAVPQPPKKLAGFRKVALAPGERRRVHLRILLRSLQSWDADTRTWRLVAGCHHVLVGRSSRDLPLDGTLAVGGASCGRGVPAART